MPVSSEIKKKVFKQYGGSETNTGSAAAQVALFTEKINHVSKHIDANKHDFSNTRSLVKMVGKRKRLLNHLMKTDLKLYRELIENLNIRK